MVSHHLDVIKYTRSNIINKNNASFFERQFNRLVRDKTSTSMHSSMQTSVPWTIKQKVDFADKIL